MALFMFIGFDQPPHSMALRDAQRKDHLQYVFDNDTKIMLVGIMEDEAGNQCGTIYAFEAESEEEVWQWVDSEPFCCAGVYETIKILRLNVALNRIPEKDWGILKTQPVILPSQPSNEGR